VAECYNMLCGVPVAGIGLVGALALAAILIFTGEKDERYGWTWAGIVTCVWVLILFFTIPW